MMKYRAQRTLLLALSGALLATGCSDTDDFSGPSNPGTPGSGASPLDFGLPTRVSLGSPGVVQSVLADLDGDGLDDLVEADLFGHQVRVAGADGGASFLAPQVIDLTEAPVTVAVADLDGDGDRELAILTVLIGQAEGMTLGALQDGLESFAASDVTLRVYDRPVGGGDLVETTSAPLPAASFQLATLDLGLAGELLVVPLPSQQSIELWRLDGAELMPFQVLASEGPTGESGPFTAAVLDLTGDGRVDLVAGEGTLLGDGPGSLALFEQTEGEPGFGPASYPEALQNAPNLPLVERIADVDGDGLDDLAALDVSDGADSLALVVTGEGAPAVGAGFVVGGPQTGAAVGDFDGDGTDELAVALFVTGELVVLPLPGFAGEVPAPTPLDIGLFPRGLRVVDLGNDGLHDLAMHHGTGTTFLLGGEDGLRGIPGYEVPNNTQFVRSADLDQDGFGDVVTLDIDQRRLSFLRGSAEGVLEPAGSFELEPTNDPLPGSFDLGDFDGDGDLDLVVALYGADVVRVYENDGQLPFGSTPVELTTPGGPLGVATADMDGDGALDVVVGRAQQRSVQVFRGDGAFGFESILNNGISLRPLAVEVGDLDGDGDPDVVFTADGSETGAQPVLLVLENGQVPDGTLSLTVRSSLGLPRIATQVLVTDLDDDATLELVVNQPGIDSTVVLVADSPGGGIDGYATFAVEALVDTAAEADPSTVAAADVDGDGRRDLLVLAATGRPVLLLNDGDLDFVVSALPGAGSATPAAPYGVRHGRLALLDDDDVPDLLLVTPDRPRLWVALGRELVGGADADE